MGTDNRQRRAAKARKRARRSAPGDRDARREPATSMPLGFGFPVADDEPPCDCFECRLDRDREAAIRFMSRLLSSAIGAVWQNGWQPLELVRQIRRSMSNEVADLLAAAVVVDDKRRAGQLKHPRWCRQIDQLVTTVRPDDVGDDWLERWIDHRGSGAPAIVDDLMVELASLGQVHRIIPPPGETLIDGMMRDDDTDDPTLARVRALLAQAESTTFPAEAEVFTAKAQALMSRHAIDEAMVHHASGVADRPVSVRLPIDDPYVSEKADLLHVVAEAARCRAIHHRNYAMSTVVGDAADLRRVELLFTSLLLQAQAALNDESSKSGAGSHRRTRRFRAAFLAAYAVRIGQRLLTERDHAVAESGDDVLPVLARQSQAVEDEVDRLFGGSLRHSRGKDRDMAGWKAGSDAAERAALRESGLDSGPSGKRAGLPAAE